MTIPPSDSVGTPFGCCTPGACNNLPYLSFIGLIITTGFIIASNAKIIASNAILENLSNGRFATDRLAMKFTSILGVFGFFSSND